MSSSPFPTARPYPSAPAPGRLTIERRTVAICGGAAALIALWAAAATIYILAKDELAQRFVAYQSDVRYAYEDRIASLRAGLEREVTQNLVERTTFQRRAEMLATRQADIEARQGWIRQMVERTAIGGGVTGSLAGAPPSAAHPLPPAAPRARPEPIAQELSFPLRRSAEIPSRPVSVPEAEPAKSEPARDRLSALETSLDRVAADELRAVEALRSDVQGRSARLRAAIEAAGIDPDRLAPAAAPGPATGGPLVPMPTSAAPSPFLAIAAETDLRSAELIGLRSAIRTLPLARPLDQEAEQTSGFGYRLDPFTRSVALHTGLDLRTETATPVRATGRGRVTEAGWSGGYGLMVEIDHGGGVATRYGHLSAMAVTVGERVEAGQVVALSGSTGRSTGPHLHYETRIGGEPVSPVRFLQAGKLLAAADAP